MVIYLLFVDLKFNNLSNGETIYFAMNGYYYYLMDGQERTCIGKLKLKIWAT